MKNPSHTLAAACAAVLLAAGCGGGGTSSDAGTEGSGGSASARVESLSAGGASHRPRKPRWEVQRLTGASPFQGVNGLAFDARGRLWAGSVMGQGLFEVNPESGAARRVVGPAASASEPSGMADDIAIGPNGDMYWSSLLLGQLQVRHANGSVATLNASLPGINSLAFHPDGRLFVTQCFLADALWQVDTVTGAATKIADNLDIAPPQLGTAGLNGFQFGRDGLLYGPLWNKGEVVAIDVDAKPVKVTTVAAGFGTPGAVNLDSRGNLWVIDVARGELVRIDAASREKTVVLKPPKLKKGLDNLAIDAHDRIFVSNPSDNSIQVYEHYNRATGTGGRVRTVRASPLSTAAGLAMADGTLYLADFFAARRIDPANGAATDIARPVADVLPYPSSISANADTIVLSSWFAGTVQVLDRRTNAIRFLQNGFVTPHDAVQQADGSLVVAELALGRLTKVSGDGTTRTTLASGLAAPVGLAYDGTDYFVTELAAGNVTRVNATTGIKTLVASGLTGPEGIALAPDGSLVVADVGKQRVVSIEASTGRVTEIATRLPIGATSPAGPPSYLQTGVAVGADGTIYFSSDLQSSVYRIVKR